MFEKILNHDCHVYQSRKLNISKHCQCFVTWLHRLKFPIAPANYHTDSLELGSLRIVNLFLCCRAGAFIFSWLFGTFLMVSVIPPILKGPRSLEVSASLITYVLLWVSSTFLKLS